MTTARRAALLLGAALTFTAPWAAKPLAAKEWPRIRIATEGAYPPFNMHAPDGRLIGYEIDLAADLCRRMAAQCEVVAQDWDGIIPGLQAGKYDAIMAGMAITPRRMEVIAFSAPYVSTPSSFAALKGTPLAGLPGADSRVSLADAAAFKAALEALRSKLKGKVIGVQVATAQAEFLNTHFKGVAEIRTYKTTEEHDLDLHAGRLDAVFADAPYLRASQDKAGGADLVFTGPQFAGGALGAGTGVGLRKSDPELKAKFDEAIAASTADGTLKRLVLQWFKLDATPQ